MVILNKKEYPDDDFVQQEQPPEFCNLKVYPLAAQMEYEAGILSHVAAIITCVLVPNGIPQFLLDNLKNFQQSVGDVEEVVVGYCTDVGCDITLAESSEFPLKVSFPGTPKSLYLKAEFKEYLNELKLYQDNLICLCMIVKNAGSLFEQVLTENLPHFDEWCILDTGSTDGTQDVIKRVLSSKYGALYEEPFINFRDSRNRCLELAGTSCKFLLMLDDTYVVQGQLRGFLEKVRGDQFSESFCICIQSHDSEYFSNRILKSSNKLRYKYTIHEVVEPNVAVTVPHYIARIKDYTNDYMQNRTNTRKEKDLELLFKEVREDPNDPRHLYYIAQTYSCLENHEKKAEYFLKRVNHPVEGYTQEKFDACFELARTYNFKLNKDWETCEKFYKQSSEIDPSRPEPYYFMGIHWYLQKDFRTAYGYFKKGFEVGYPIDKQFSLKPTLSFHYLPKFLAEVCYYIGDHEIGEKASKLFLEKMLLPESQQLMQSWYGIHSNLVKLGTVNQIPTVDTRDIFCIVADGNWNKWSGSHINTNGLGGSETWVVEMSRNIPKSFPGTRVIVFCQCEKGEMFEFVEYAPIEYFHNFVANNIVKYCIISRFTEYVPVALKSHCQNVGIIFHDIVHPETIIPVDPKLKWVFCLTDWHSRSVREMFPQFSVQTLNYGIDSSRFRPLEKVQNSFIYSSFPNRGLVILLKMWKRIVEKFPEAELHLYCDLEGEWVNRVAKDEMIEIKSLMTDSPGVFEHGWVDKVTLSEAWSTAEYWLYPCKFEETFCLTALEAAITKTFVVSNNLAALGETVGDRGLVVHGDATTQRWQDEVLEKLFKYMSREVSKEVLIEKNYTWAKSLSWEKQSRKMCQQMGVSEGQLDYCGMLNWTNDETSVRDFQKVFKLLPKNPKVLEVGTFAGTSIYHILKNLPGSTGTVIDSWEDYTEKVGDTLTIVSKMSELEVEKVFYKNTKGLPIRVLKGKSSEKLFEIQELFDFIYVDGSHKCLDVYLDGTLSWQLLKPGGVLVFDDYLFNKGNTLESPYEAINHFIENNKCKVLMKNWRIFLQK
jgi:glycosyltransferase involved in cell wall biosynthesis